MFANYRCSIKIKCDCAFGEIIIINLVGLHCSDISVLKEIEKFYEA